MGNQSKATINGVQYVYNPSPTSNQIVSVTQTGGGRYFYYVPSGQVYSDQRNPSSDYQFGHDGYGRMASASLNNSSLATYVWNGFDQRAVKAAATTTDFVYDRAGHMIAEMNDATGAALREYVWMDDTPVAMVDYSGGSPVVYDIHTDHLGRPQKLTDQSGGLQWDGVFDPFGNPYNINGSLTMLLGFPGQYWDSETQLAQNWHRDYDPSIGRYIGSDQFGLAAGINSYVYADNNPLIDEDPLGWCWLYSQSTGELTHVDQNGNATDAGAGYSGNGAGLNNPAAQNAPNVGPIPQGNYTIGPQQNNGGLIASMRLNPDSGNQMFGRSGFLIHGPHRNDQHDSSEGCVILDRSMRDQIANSGDNCFRVVP